VAEVGEVWSGERFILKLVYFPNELLCNVREVQTKIVPVVVMYAST
jgi:hypothetical protein